MNRDELMAVLNHSYKGDEIKEYIESLEGKIQYLEQKVTDLSKPKRSGRYPWGLPDPEDYKNIDIITPRARAVDAVLTYDYKSNTVAIISKTGYAEKVFTKALEEWRLVNGGKSIPYAKSDLAELIVSNVNDISAQKSKFEKEYLITKLYKLIYLAMHGHDVCDKEVELLIIDEAKSDVEKYYGD